MRCALYARFSTDAQSAESVVDQLRRCRDYATGQAWEILGEFSDEGISGAALGNRPGVRRALEVVQSGDVLVVTDADRLSRSQDLAPLVTRLRHRGVRVLGILDRFDSDAATARMHAGLSGIMSEEFRASIARRTHSALDMRAREGKSTGRVAYGYRTPEEAEVVREIFARSAAGESMRAIAGDLNARGVPSPGATWERKTRRADGRWMLSTLHAMLENERYIGRVVWNKSRWLRDPDSGIRQRRERPPAEWIVREDEAARLVDLATWEAVRARMDGRRAYGGGKGGKPRALLSGLLRCEQCGGALILVGEPRRYACSSFRHGGEAACSMRLSVRREVAEDAILGPVESQLATPEAVALAVKVMRDELRRAAAPGAEPAEIQRLEVQVRQVEELIASGMLAGEVGHAALGQARESLARQRRRGGEAPVRLWPAAALAAAYRAAVATWRETVTRADPDGARAALRQIVGQIPVRPAADGKTLEAMLEVDVRPLLVAAGHGSDGSGGMIRSRSWVRLAPGRGSGGKQ